ncbi:MAG: cytochrome d ubiquinol oxidase subunit II [Elusimicrobia bacterium]|nr:cytochrome d ubiquinol oxidase subunit II [Elusimicrobiota bacterium]
MPEALAAALLFAALAAYALTGGADFGAGVWDLLAAGPRAERQRRAVGAALAPIWEVNHVWLIAALVLTFTAFPAAFAAISIWLHVPLALALAGIVLRGAAFVFRGYGFSSLEANRRWGRLFALASTFTPIMLGVCAGALASGRLRASRPPQGAEFFTVWLAPFPIAAGLLALALLAYLAAAYLCVEVQDEPDLREDFRRRTLASGAAAGLLALVCLALAAPGRGAPALALRAAAAAAAVGGLAAFWRRRFRLGRFLAAAEVSLLLLGWAAGQFPYLIPPELTYAQAAAPVSVLRPVLWAFLCGSALLAPALGALFYVFKRPYLL